jgi:hypothetical protein
VTEEKSQKTWNERVWNVSNLVNLLVITDYHRTGPGIRLVRGHVDDA